VNKFFIASALALASLAATAIPSNAASVVVKTDHGHYDHHHHDRHCFNKKVTSWHHGHKVVHEERVCR
jgi:hypothetical protein